MVWDGDIGDGVDFPEESEDSTVMFIEFISPDPTPFISRSIGLDATFRVSIWIVAEVSIIIFII
jgi:hypothetical protein